MVQGYFAEENDALVIDFDQIWKAVRSRPRVLLGVTVLFTVFSTAFSFVIYHDKYESVGTLLFNATDAAKIITNVDTGEQFLRGDGLDTNPYKSQEELLKSHLIIQRITEKLKKDNPTLQKQRRLKFLDKALSASQMKGTNLIRLAALASSPEMAKKIADAYMESYLELISDISSASLQQNKKLFAEQVVQAEKDLDVINLRIRDYQERYGILNLNVESQGRVSELVNLDSSTKSVEADLAQKQAEAARIRSQLSLRNGDIHTAIQAVATGQDDQLTDLSEKLQDAQKEYAAKSLIYAQTNPDMEQLKQKIDVLKTQIADQHTLTIGQSSRPKSGIIRDSVRVDLVNRLAMAESAASAFQNKLGAMRGQYQQLRASLKDLPQHELDYARLQLDKKTKEDILTRLKQNLSEVKIQEAALHKKLMVIDKPNFPEKPITLPRWLIITATALIGLALSILVISIQTVMGKKRVRPEFVEQVLGLPILSIIPWLSDEQWQHYRSRGRLEALSSGGDPHITKAYQDLALNLKVQRNANQENAFAVSALLKNPEHSVIMANLGFCLAQSGESVLLIDANLRKPRLHNMFHHGLDYENGLIEVINSISECLYQKKEVYADDILPLIKRAATPSNLHPQLEYLNAGLALDQTFEFLNSKGFSTLIRTSKLSYDWVLVDSPPFLEQPDGAVLLGYVDGLLLLVEQDADEAQVTAVKNKVAKLHSSIPGIVLRRQS